MRGACPDGAPAVGRHREGLGWKFPAPRERRLSRRRLAVGRKTASADARAAKRRLSRRRPAVGRHREGLGWKFPAPRERRLRPRRRAENVNIKQERTNVLI